ncbi:MAG TPA: carotenoid biosynthesis protein [Ktedonobacteraceae bacterium]|nr:carotenoid biosynthesis protein [Ktedonobacteraceae bacterium]
MRNKKLLMTILWILVAVNTVATLASTLFSLSIPVPLLLLVSVAFALLHGAMRYHWSGIVIFIVICLVVSNILENTSILTGFPFGHYHYTDALGPKLFLVPLVIGLAYFSTGYLAWVLSTILIGDVRRKSSAFTTFAVPFIASFLMVVWDLCFDPTSSTIHHRWIWEQGGGYFGVPFTNYLGWFFTVYVFFQLFALFLRFRKAAHEETQTLPRSYYAQAVVMYAAIGLMFVLAYLVDRGNTLVTDAVGVVWQTRSIAEAEATVSIYTMLFIAALSAVKLFQGSADAPNTSVEAETEETMTKRSSPMVK